MRTACLVARVVEPLKGALLEVRLPRAGVLPVHEVVPAEVDPLGELPRLRAGEEEEGDGEDDAPLLADGAVEEDDLVDDGDVDGGHGAEEADEDGPEEERVAPEAEGPALGVGDDAVEEGAPEVDKLPGEDGEGPHHDRVAGRAGAEHAVALLRVLHVAVVAQVAVVEAEENGGEGAE